MEGPRTMKKHLLEDDGDDEVKTSSTTTTPFDAPSTSTPSTPPSSSLSATSPPSITVSIRTPVVSGGYRRSSDPLSPMGADSTQGQYVDASDATSSQRSSNVDSAMRNPWGTVTPSKQSMEGLSPTNVNHRASIEIAVTYIRDAVHARRINRNIESTISGVIVGGVQKEKGILMDSFTGEGSIDNSESLETGASENTQSPALQSIREERDDIDDNGDELDEPLESLDGGASQVSRADAERRIASKLARRATIPVAKMEETKPFFGWTFLSGFGLSSMQAYRWTHNPWWRNFVFLCIIAHLLLTSWEDPSLVSVPRLGEVEGTLGFAIHTTITVFLLLTYSLDAMLREHSHEITIFGSRSDRWAIAKVVIILLILTEVGVNSCLYLSSGMQFLLTRILRPFFLLERGRGIRKVFLNTFAAVPSVLTVTLMYLVVLANFSILGWILFSPKNLGVNPRFETLKESTLTLFILLSTVNFPDCMMPSYHHNRWSVLFFIAYIFFSIFFMMRLFLAVIYNGYQQKTSESVAHGVMHQSNGLIAAFHVLTNDPINVARAEEEVRGPRSMSMVDPVSSKASQKIRAVTRETFREIMTMLRPKIDAFHTDIIFDALDVDKKGVLTASKWMRLCDVVEVKFKHKSHDDLRAFTPTDETALYAVMLEPCCSRGCLSYYEKVRETFRDILEYRAIKWFFDILIPLNILVVVLQEELSREDDNNRVFQFLNSFFIGFFAFEVFLKLVAYGFKTFRKDWYNRIDVIVLTVTIIFSFLYPNTHSGSTLRLVCVFRLFRNVEGFNIIVSTFISMLRSVFSLFGVLFCIFYFFAMIGMWSFNGVVTYERTVSIMTVRNPDLAAFYISNYYYDNNMNDFASAMVTLFELNVVNNWHDIMNGYVALTEGYEGLTYTFFIGFYFVSVLIVMNVVFAFILDTYLTSLALKAATNQDKWKLRVLRVLKERGENETMYQITRKLRTVHVYRSLFNSSAMMNGGLDFEESDKQRKRATELFLS